MAENIGVRTASFVQLNIDTLKPLQRLFGEYMKDLDRLRKHIGSGDIPVPMLVRPAKEIVGITDNGFPLLPDISFIDMKKDQLEDLLRTYLNAHYSM